MAFIASLISSDDKSADSVIVGGMFALVTFCALSVFDVIGQHHEFGPINFGAGAGGILAAIGGAKRLRDGGGSNAS